MERLVPDPGPVEMTSGIMPATSAMVVIRMGRRRSRFAWTMASRRSMPCERSSFVWSIWRIAFFFTTPKSSSRPRPEKMFTVCPITSSERMPKGTASGSVSRMVMGWMNDSNCAASTMYMKMNESAKASMK
jgi:hypothetical protein